MAVGLKQDRAWSAFNGGEKEGLVVIFYGDCLSGPAKEVGVPHPDLYDCGQDREGGALPRAQAHPLIVVDTVRAPDDLHVVVGRRRRVDRDDHVAGILGVEGPVDVRPSWLAHGLAGDPSLALPQADYVLELLDLSLQLLVFGGQR